MYYSGTNPDFFFLEFADSLISGIHRDFWEYFRTKSNDYKRFCNILGPILILEFWIVMIPGLREYVGTFGNISEQKSIHFLVLGSIINTIPALIHVSCWYWITLLVCFIVSSYLQASREYTSWRENNGVFCGNKRH